MRILALADIHGYPRGEATVRKLAHQTSPDIIAIAGDLTGQTGIGSTRELLAALPVPTMVVPGNIDGRTAVASFTTGKARNIDLDRAVFGEFTFIGIGGISVPAAEGRGAAGELSAIEEKLSGLAGPKTVILTHIPPLGRLDSVPVPAPFASGRGETEHIGSHFIRRAVERLRPVLVISGHVHEHRGIERDGTTLYVNPGPAQDGFGAVVEMDRRPSARLLETS